MGGEAPVPCRLPGSGEPVVKRLDGGWRRHLYENQRTGLERRQRRGGKTGPYTERSKPYGGHRRRRTGWRQRKGNRLGVKGQVPTGRKAKGTRSTKRLENTHKRTRPGAWWDELKRESTYPWWSKTDETFRGRPTVYGGPVWPLEQPEEREPRGVWSKGTVDRSVGEKKVSEQKRSKIGTRQIGSVGTHEGEGGVPIGRREWVWRPGSSGAGTWEGLTGTGLQERRSVESNGAKGRGVVTEDYERRPSGREASKIERQRSSKVEVRRLGCSRDAIRYSRYARRQRRGGHHEVVVDKRKGIDRTTGESPLPSEWHLGARRRSRKPGKQIRRKKVW